MPTSKAVIVHCLQDDVVAAIVAARYESDPPDALLIGGIHDLCVALIWPDQADPWTPNATRASLANIGGLWSDGEAIRLAIKEQLRWFSAIHPRGFSSNPIFRDAFAKRFWQQAAQAFTAKTCRAARILAPHMVPKPMALPKSKPVKLVGLPLELSNRGKAPVHAPPPEKAKPAIPRQSYILLAIAVNAGKYSGWLSLFRGQEQFPKTTFMFSWHRSLGAPDGGQAAPPIRAWSRWSRFKNSFREPDMREPTPSRPFWPQSPRAATPQPPRYTPLSPA